MEMEMGVGKLPGPWTAWSEQYLCAMHPLGWLE